MNLNFNELSKILHFFLYETAVMSIPKPAVPKRFGLRTPFATKYFSRNQYQIYLDIIPYCAKKPTVNLK